MCPFKAHMSKTNAKLIHTFVEALFACCHPVPALLETLGKGEMGEFSQYLSGDWGGPGLHFVFLHSGWHCLMPLPGSQRNPVNQKPGWAI